MNEFKKIKNNNETRYVLETMTAGATGASAIATAEKDIGEVQKRIPDTSKPRNFVAKNAKMGGAGQHKDKKKAEKQGDVKHRKPFAEQGVAEGSGPKEKQKTPYRDINSPEYRAAADKQKQRMAKDKAAEPGKKMLAKQGVAEGSDKEDEYGDDYQAMVGRVGQQAKQAQALKSKGKEPRTRWNPVTKKYYVDFSDTDDNGVAKGKKQLDELFEPSTDYYTLSNGKMVQVNYRSGTDGRSAAPFTDVNVSYVNPALKPMGPSFDSTGVAQPWTSAPAGVKQAIQKFVTQPQQGVAEGNKENKAKKNAYVSSIIQKKLDPSVLPSLKYGRRELKKDQDMLEETYDNDDEFFEAYGVMEYNDEMINEGEYQGRKVTLNKPVRSSGGPKKFHVFVKNPKGNVVKVNFGQKGARIKKNNPVRRSNFRARHNCDNPGPKTGARYWSCRNW
jgi:hypothetical protein